MVSTSLLLIPPPKRPPSQKARVSSNRPPSAKPHMRVETPPILVPLISGGRPAAMALVTSGFFAGPAIGDRSSPAIMLAVFSGAAFPPPGLTATGRAPFVD